MMQLIYLQYGRQIKQRLANTTIRQSAERIVNASCGCNDGTVSCAICPLFVMSTHQRQICICAYRWSTDLVRRMLEVHA